MAGIQCADPPFEHLVPGGQMSNVELDLIASAAALTALLHTVETAEPSILVDRLAVQVPETGAGAKTVDGQALLNINLRLFSYARPAMLGGGHQ